MYQESLAIHGHKFDITHFASQNWCKEKIGITIRQGRVRRGRLRGDGRRRRADGIKDVGQRFVGWVLRVFVHWLTFFQCCAQARLKLKLRVNWCFVEILKGQPSDYDVQQSQKESE